MFNMNLHTRLDVIKFIIWAWGEFYHHTYRSCPPPFVGNIDGWGHDRLVSKIRVATLVLFGIESTLTGIKSGMHKKC